MEADGIQNQSITQNKIQQWFKDFNQILDQGYLH